MATGVNKEFPNPLKSWCFTVQNYTPEDEERVKALAPLAVRLAVGREIAPTTGTPHLQGYVRFKVAHRALWVQDHIKPLCWIHPRDGTEAQASHYALEDGDILIDHGIDQDRGRGTKRTRDQHTEEIIEEIDKGETYGRIFNRHRGFMFWHHRNFEGYMYRAQQLAKDPDWCPFGHLAEARPPTINFQL